MLHVCKVFISIILSACLLDVSGQKIEVSSYKNKAQAYAILSAQYSNDAYTYVRRGLFINAVETIKSNCDTAFVLVEIAKEYADSAFQVSGDSCEYAIAVLNKALEYQGQTQNHLKDIKAQVDLYAINEALVEATYALTNAVADAYEASLFFKTGNPKTIFEEDLAELSHDTISENVVEKPKERDVSRLESDEFSIMTIKDIYGKRVQEIDAELKLLQNEIRKDQTQNRPELVKLIQQLKSERKDLMNKYEGSDDKLIQVRNELSEEMLKVVNKDLFTTEKTGFYSEQIPIPQNVELPKGLVYKIQIGFFKNQLPEAHFDGLFPLSSEKVDEVYFRYSAGSFKKYQEARDAITDVKSKGYTDSFIVAYFDGEKVPMHVALEKEKK